MLPRPRRSLAWARQNEVLRSAAEHACDQVRPRTGRLRTLAAMTVYGREQVFGLVQAHLADELDLEPGMIGEGPRFREDLEADSLDLYTLVQELEDTYGVSMSDEQAARILTVGQ